MKSFFRLNRNKICLCLGIAPFLVFQGGASWAAPAELVLQLDSSLRYDSNPLRFPDTTPVPPSLGTTQKSSSYLANEVRGALVQPLDSPETRLILSGNLSHQNYQNLNTLNNTEGALRGIFQWRLGELWRGELSHIREQQLFRPLDGGVTDRVMIQAATTSALVALRPTPELEFPVQIGQQTIEYNSAALQAYNRKDQTLDASARWRTWSTSTLRGGMRSVRSTFSLRTPEQVIALDSEYEDRELYAGAEWQYSVKTRLSGRVGYLQRHYAHLTTRDFSVLTTEAQLLYEYSPLTRVQLELWNRPFGMTDPNNLYSIATGAQGSVRWFATPKTRVTAALTQERQTYEPTATGAALGTPVLNRQRWAAGLVHELTRDLRVYAEGFRETVKRGALGADIHQNALRVGLEYSYENLTGVAQRNGLAERRQ